MNHRFLFSLGLLALLAGGCASKGPELDNTNPDPQEPEKPEPPEEPEPAVTCELGLVAHEEGGEGAVELSNDDLTATSSKVTQIARAAASRVDGRWYYEVTVDSLVGSEALSQNIGVAVEGVISTVGDTAYMGALYNATGAIASSIDGSTSIGGGAQSAVAWEPFATGDVIGVALDLDAGRVYFSKNGQWPDGTDPAEGKGGAEVLVVPGTGAYYPVLYLSDGDAMTANFGESDFAAEAPEGFLPFAQDFEEDDDGNCVDPGPAGVPAPPAPMEAACEDFTSYRAESEGQTELHIVGIHERGEDGPKATVHVSRTTELVLALSSHAFTQWNVTLDEGAQVKKILLVGDVPSRVTIPDDVEIEIETQIYDKNDAKIEAGYVWPNAPGGSDTPDLIRAVEDLTGLTMTSFGGCADGASFTLLDDE